jgi:hypothetical protein
VITPNPCDGSPVLTRLVINNPAMTGAMAAEERPLRIDIPIGGSIRMCDPHPNVAAGDPRACPAP